MEHAEPSLLSLSELNCFSPVEPCEDRTETIFFSEDTYRKELYIQEVERLNVVCREMLAGHKIFIDKTSKNSLCASAMRRTAPLSGAIDFI